MNSMNRSRKASVFLLFIFIGFILALSEVHAKPSTSGLLYSSDLVYKGAFAFPKGDVWSYSGQALTYRPQGDKSDPDDGFSGSLYVTGHVNNKGVGEISIPKPIISKDRNKLLRARVLQGQQDITGGHIDNCVYYTRDGRKKQCTYREISGLEYLDDVRKVAWNVRDWYNVSGLDMDSLGWSNLDMTHAQGLWHIGERFNTEFHNGKTCNYLFKAPKAFSDKYLKGKWLISGNHRQAGAHGGSQGPTLYASAPWEHGNPPKPRIQVASIALLYYPEIYPDCIEKPALCHYKGYRADDSWGGGAWVEVENRTAVLIFGRKGQGKNFYGDGRGMDCSPYKGWHSGPYVPLILFYSPHQLAEVAVGKRKPWKVLPYDTYVPKKEIHNLRCGEFISVAYDSDRKIIYAVEAVDEGSRVVHVWSILNGK